jgi:hypothetical protein
MEDAGDEVAVDELEREYDPLWLKCASHTELISREF